MSHLGLDKRTTVVYYTRMTQEMVLKTKEVTRVPVAKGNTRVSVTLDKELYETLLRRSRREERTLAGQIRHELKLALSQKKKADTDAGR